ncbi:MAG: acetyl-CoA acetyltransferase [Lentisphaerae bacterium RIFOXYB12_FULL_65_16]|nr:MAG: acetyl-CoA acetyltransferase [Lentisphaerae bacterium RIFOXYA12_64_32]OGV88932.1 MAG: acetyl-CoA acetyltransferase [Lentisphaerae bacterium RIFOXYB12_FULL_65_16]
MREVVIVGAVRTAIGKFGGAFADTLVTELGATVVREALRRAGVAPDAVNEVILGHVLQAGSGLNPARQVLLKAGIPQSVPAFTVNKVCASGLKAVALGAAAVAAGEHDIVVAGGMENMSAAPFVLRQARWGYRLGDGELLDVILRDALQDPLEGIHMGVTAENVATDLGISRRDQDEFAAQSQQKAGAAMQAGKFASEIVPVPVSQKKGAPLPFSVDEFPRPDTTVEVLAKLKPAFKGDGTVTAGNASGINDGAAAMVLMSRAEADRRGIRPLASILSYASAGVDPTRMGLGPVPATTAALAKAGKKLTDIDAFELNEAFAAQSLAVIRQLGVDPVRANLNGGAIALGHPVGASGARILVTLLHILADRGLRFGLATLCVGGGQGMAMIVERR